MVSHEQWWFHSSHLSNKLDPGFFFYIHSVYASSLFSEMKMGWFNVMQQR